MSIWLMTKGLGGNSLIVKGLGWTTSPSKKINLSRRCFTNAAALSPSSNKNITLGKRYKTEF